MKATFSHDKRNRLVEIEDFEGKNFIIEGISREEILQDVRDDYDRQNDCFYITIDGFDPNSMYGHTQKTERRDASDYDPEPEEVEEFALKYREEWKEKKQTKTASRIPKISQSLIKGFEDFKNGSLCGQQFRAKYLEKVNFPSSKVQRLGNWFEYMATGTLPRDGQVPIPERTAKGELTAPYQKMLVQVETFKRTMNHYGFEILETGVKLEDDENEGTLDIIAKTTKPVFHIPENAVCIIDVKSTGLLNDKWNELGWDLEGLDQKRKLLLQPVQYKKLAEAKFGLDDVPFFFFIFSNTNEIESRIVLVELDKEARYLEHENTVEQVKFGIQEEINKGEKGFRALPEIKTCAECPLALTCPKFSNVPSIYKLYY